jgi:DNA-binding PadR family transcriptional regulator
MSSTRLLILGVVRLFQPVHGYEIRRELMSWSAEDWATVAYGSIYHALNMLTRDGLLEVVGTDQVGRRPARTSYQLTPQGDEEYFRLLRDAWWRPEPIKDPFIPAWSFIQDLPKDELVAALRYRAQWARSRADSARFLIDSPVMREKPPVVAEMLRLDAARADTDLAWVESMIEKVERGELP